MIKSYFFLTLIGAMILFASCEEQQPSEVLKEGDFDKSNYYRPNVSWFIADNQDTTIRIKIITGDTGYRKIIHVYFEYSDNPAMQNAVKQLEISSLSHNSGYFTVDNLKPGISYWGRLIVSSDIDTFVYGIQELKIKVKSLRNYFSGLLASYPITLKSQSLDESGNDFHAFDWVVSPTTDRYGQSNCAYSFDGVNSYMSIFRSEDMSSLQTTDYTYACWINPEPLFSGVTYSPIIEKEAVPGYGFRFALAMRYNSQWGANVYEIVAQNVQFSPALAVEIGKWAFLTVTYSVTGISFYVNGSLVYYQPSSESLKMVHNNRLRIGRSISGNDYFRGKIDNISIWNRALTAAEVMELYKL